MAIQAGSIISASDINTCLSNIYTVMTKNGYAMVAPESCNYIITGGNDVRKNVGLTYNTTRSHQVKATGVQTLRVTVNYAFTTGMHLYVFKDNCSHTYCNSNRSRAFIHLSGNTYHGHPKRYRFEVEMNGFDTITFFHVRENNPPSYTGNAWGFPTFYSIMFDDKDKIGKLIQVNSGDYVAKTIYPVASHFLHFVSDMCTDVPLYAYNMMTKWFNNPPYDNALNFPPFTECGSDSCDNRTGYVICLSFSTVA